MSADFNPDGPECSNDCECWEWAEWVIVDAARVLRKPWGISHAEERVLADLLCRAWDVIQTKREVESS